MKRPRIARAPRRAATDADPAAPRARRRVRRVRLDNDLRRAQLIQLGMAAFSERTYDEVSIDDLARAAGVSKGLLYHYFRTKRDFYVAGLREIARELLEKTLGRVEAGTPLERVRDGLDAYLDHVGGHARAFVALMRGGIGSDPEVAAVIEEVRTAYVDRFLEDIAGSPLAGVAVGNPLFRIAVRGWIGFIEAASIDWLSRPEVERARVRDLILEMLVAMLRAAGASLPHA